MHAYHICYQPSHRFYCFTLQLAFLAMHLNVLLMPYVSLSISFTLTTQLSNTRVDTQSQRTVT